MEHHSICAAGKEDFGDTAALRLIGFAAQYFFKRPFLTSLARSPINDLAFVEFVINISAPGKNCTIETKRQPVIGDSDKLTGPLVVAFSQLVQSVGLAPIFQEIVRLLLLPLQPDSLPRS